jgi:hypothetical protein
MLLAATLAIVVLTVFAVLAVAAASSYPPGK